MAASPHGAAVLTILRNGETIRTVPLEGQGDVVLGRSDGCVIRLEDRAISRQHAVFRVVDGGVQVERKSEFAPLMVNGTECTRAILKEADVIAIGPYLMRINRGAIPNVPGPIARLAENILPEQPLEALEPLEMPLPAHSGEDTHSLEGSGGEQDPPSMGELAQLADSLDSRDSRDSRDTKEEASLEGLAPMELDNDQNGAIGLEGLEGLRLPDSGQSSEAPSASPGDEPGYFEMAEEDAATKLTPQAKLRVQVEFRTGDANVETLELTKDEISIGRGKDCDIVLNDKKASRKNAVIRRAGLSFSIKDLDSANGTYVNGVRVAEQELVSDDLVRIGHVEFRFKALSADYLAREGQFIPVPAESDGASQIPEAPENPDPPVDGAFPSIIDNGDPAALARLQGQIGTLSPDGQPAPGTHPGGVPGITGIGPPDTKRMGFVDKIKNFRTIPLKDKIIVVLILGSLAYLFLDEDGEVDDANQAAKKPAAKASVLPGKMTYEMLNPEQKRFVEAQRNLAFELFKNQEYDKSLYELEKLFNLLPDGYMDAKDIRDYAREGKRKKEALEEEKRKKEAEAALKAKVQGLLDECRERMNKKQYEQARELFAEISVLDPDNQQVALWRKDIEDWEEARRLEQQAKQVQAEINTRAWDVFKEGMGLKKQGRFHAAIETFVKVGDIGASDKKVIAAAGKQIGACKAAIKALRDPVLAQAREAENTGDMPKAFALFQRATRIDPPHPEGYAGMARVRGILHERSKSIYIEAVMAESYSDFVTARKKFKECLETSPTDDIYHERAERKLARYYRGILKEESGGGP
jgi:pSer/pThr/pTyr-binding forkhead associated (FHA) protein